MTKFNYKKGIVNYLVGDETMTVIKINTTIT